MPRTLLNFAFENVGCNTYRVYLDGQLLGTVQHERSGKWLAYRAGCSNPIAHPSGLRWVRFCQRRDAAKGLL